MDNNVIGMLGIALLAVIFGGVPRGIWSGYSGCARKGKVGVPLATPPFALLAVWAVTLALHANAYSDCLADIYDTANVTLGTTLYTYNSPRSFNGDGYSFYMYELPAEIRRRFETADKRLLTEFPKRPGYRSHWKEEHWREAPFDPRFARYLDFALSSYDSGKESKLSPHFQNIRNALSRKRSYYAFFYYNTKGNSPADIDLFIVDLERGRIYIINHNT